MHSRRTSRSRRRIQTGKRANPARVEWLENRMVMASDPFPLLTDLEDQMNPVVRLETNFGDIDIELFIDDAPITVANFLDYVREGDYDQTFFHRLIDGFVLQGGGFRFDPDEGAIDIPTEDPIVNEFDRTNAERTIAMAKLPSGPNTATSQWFFNLDDNAGTPPNGLDFQNGGFTVFGRVVNDRSWDVVTTIAGLDTFDFGSPFDDLPVTDEYDGVSTITSEDLVMIVDAEIIKPSDVAAFYRYRYYYPEGFAGSTINEFLPMANAGNSASHYQVITRSEVAQSQSGDNEFWFRDKVIDTSSIAAHSRGGPSVFTFTSGDTDLIFQQGVPYAFEVWTTEPISVNLSHYDNGSATGENFATEAAEEWFLTGGVKEDGVFSFPVWQNTSDTEANITLTFYFRNQNPIVFSTTTEAFRRGGLNITDFPTLPDNSSFAVRIESDQPIVAALTQYDTNFGGGSTTLGTPNGGLNAGVLPLAKKGANANATNTLLEFVNPTSTTAVITLRITFTDPSTNQIVVTPASLVIQPNRRSNYVLSDVPGLANGVNVSVVYTSGSTNVVAGAYHYEHQDIVANPFAHTAATRNTFSEGFMDAGRAGDDVFETISVYNPNSALFGVTDTDANVTFRFLYNDGTVVTVNRTVAAGKPVDIKLHELEELLEQGPMFGRYYYSIEVVSNIPVIAQMNHYDLTLGDLQPSGGFGVLGTQSGDIYSLDDLTTPV